MGKLKVHIYQFHFYNIYNIHTMTITTLINYKGIITAKLLADSSFNLIDTWGISFNEYTIYL